MTLTKVRGETLRGEVPYQYINVGDAFLFEGFLLYKFMVRGEAINYAPGQKVFFRYIPDSEIVQLVEMVNISYKI